MRTREAANTLRMVSSWERVNDDITLEIQSYLRERPCALFADLRRRTNGHDVARSHGHYDGGFDDDSDRHLNDDGSIISRRFYR